MKSSAVQQAFKGIASRIHPQLPLSAKESQRLLNALTSSFNHQLDQGPTKSTAHAVAPRQHDDSARSSSSLSSTDLHLASILTSPLFGKPAQPSASSSTLHQLRSKTVHPIKVFEDSVSKGEATLEIARLCLSAFRVLLKNLSENERRVQLDTTAAGTRVLKWLWASGKIHAYSFTEDGKFLDSLTYFLLKESNESALWDLMETMPHSVSTKDSHSFVRDVRRRKSLILVSLVKSHLYISPSSDAALSAFLRVSDGANSTSVTASDIHLLPAGFLLSKQLVHAHLKKHAQASSASLYDRFVQSCPLWDKNSPDRALYRVAGLKLHHPVSPSARDALYFIRHLKQSPGHPFLSPSTDSQRKDVFKFFFDTVQVLQSQGYEDDSAWVMDFMKQSFPQYLSEQKSASSTVEATVLPSSDHHHSRTSNEPVLLAWMKPDLV